MKKPALQQISRFWTVRQPYNSYDSPQKLDYFFYKNINIICVDFYLIFPIMATFASFTEKSNDYQIDYLEEEVKLLFKIPLHTLLTGIGQSPAKKLKPECLGTVI